MWSAVHWRSHLESIIIHILTKKLLRFSLNPSDLIKIEELISEWSNFVVTWCVNRRGGILLSGGEIKLISLSFLPLSTFLEEKESKEREEKAFAELVGLGRCRRQMRRNWCYMLLVWWVFGWYAAVVSSFLNLSTSILTPN